MKGNDWKPGRDKGHDKKGQKDTNNWGEKEKKKIETTDSIGLLPISIYGPPQGPLTPDPALLQSSLIVRITSLITARSFHFKIYPSQ